MRDKLIKFWMCNLGMSDPINVMIFKSVIVGIIIGTFFVVVMSL
jgi:hypothetical protein